MKKGVLISIIAVSALAVGAGAGALIKKFLSKPKVEYTGFNPDYAKYNATELIQEVESVDSVEGKIKKFSPTKISQYSLEKYKKCENCVSFCIGDGKAVSVHMDIRNAQIKVGNNYFEETTTKSSVLSFSKRAYQEGKSSPVKFYNEKSAKDISISEDRVHTNFKEEFESLTQTEFSRKIGRSLPDMFGYLVHDSTITKETITETSDGYVVDLETDPVKVTFNYRNQIKNFANLQDYPIYYGATFQYVVDKNLQLKEAHIIERYKATVISIQFDVVNTLHNYFLSDYKSEIPEITEDFDYKSFSELIK